MTYYVYMKLFKGKIKTFCILEGHKQEWGAWKGVEMDLAKSFMKRSERWIAHAGTSDAFIVS